MIYIDKTITATSLLPAVDNVFAVACEKIERLNSRWQPAQGSPVFTVNGQYTSRGWTEWTQGFQFGMSLLQFDGTGDERFLEIGRTATRNQMAVHLTHIGVHDHGFNNVSTYGNLLRLASEDRFNASTEALETWRLALKVSGAVQAARWTPTHDGGGFIHSFNGPHSLFSDTIRSLRALAIAHQLGHALFAEHDEKINLLDRLLTHAEATATYNIYYGKGRDRYDIRGRVVHESIFNTTDGRYRCPSSQQGYSPFTTWTRGQAWALCGYPEQLEWLDTLPESQFEEVDREKNELIEIFAGISEALADFYIDQTPSDGVPYWDTGAPGLDELGDYLNQPSQPDNEHEPIDSSAAAIAAQGLLRLGRFLTKRGDDEVGARYFTAGLTVAQTLFSERYLSHDPTHEGLLLHSVYHHPNGWDHTPTGKTIPMGEACMWGDYHLLELAVYLKRLAEEQPYYTFFTV